MTTFQGFPIMNSYRTLRAMAKAEGQATGAFFRAGDFSNYFELVTLTFTGKNWERSSIEVYA